MKYILPLLLLIGSCFADVAYDSQVSSHFNFGVTTITTPSFTIGAGSNRAAIACLGMNSNAATGITISVGGVNGSLITGSDSGATGTNRTLCYCITNPPSGSQTATASWTSSMNADLGVITATGVDQVNSCSHGVFASFVNAPTAAVSITVAAFPGDLTTSIGYTFDAWVGSGTNQTLKWGLDSGVIGGDIGPGTGTTTHTWTDTFAGQSISVSGASFNKVHLTDTVSKRSPMVS